MCAVFGIGIIDKKKVNYEVLQSVLKKLIISSQIRGFDATGIAFTNTNSISILKHNVIGEKYVQLPEYKHTVNEYLSKNKNKLISIIGHCRAQTQGSHTNSKNNHPIRIGNIIGVHNGHINNDADLFLSYNAVTKMKRQAEVDSEIIFSLINHYSLDEEENQISPNPITNAIKAINGKLIGDYSCALINSEEPTNLWLFRKTNPLKINYFKKEGLIIFTSTDAIIRQAIETTNFNTPTSITLDEKHGMCINLKELKYNIFRLK